MTSKRRRPDSREDGFTLLELLVVLAILVFIAVIAVPQTIKYLDRAKTDTARVSVENIGAALDLFRLDVGRYPTEQEGLAALVRPTGDIPRWDGPYLRKEAMIVDPWGNPYRYRFPGEYGEFDIYSYGGDDTEGGDGANQDVVSW